MSELCPDAEECSLKELAPCPTSIQKKYSNCPFKRSGYALIEAPENYKSSLKTIDWHGFYVKVGPGYSPFFFNELETIRKNIEACIIVITGPAGKGKTYFGLRLAEIMDTRFNVNAQVPFGSDEFLKLISEDSPLKMGQVIVPDETQFTMGSRDWYKDIQRDLMNQLEAVRSKGYIIILVALNMKVLDIIARNYVITHLIHMKRRGEGVAYKFYMPAFATEPYKTKLGTVKLKLPGYETCQHPTCLRCQFSGLKKTHWAQREKWVENNYPLCMSIRAIYERKKKSYLEAETQKTEAKRRKKEKLEISNEELAKIIEPKYSEITKVRNGRMNPNSIAHLLSGITQTHVSRVKADAIRTILENQHPEWIPAPDTTKNK